MMYKFTATGKRANTSFTLLNRYTFVKGELVVSGKEAKAIKPILVDFYACTIEKMAEVEDEGQVKPDKDVDIETEDDTP